MTKDIEYQLVLNKQIGPVLLSMKKDELRKLLNEMYTPTAAHIDEELGGMEINASDYFEKSGVKVEYDKLDKVVFIEVGYLVPVYYDSVSLFEASYAELFDTFKKLDPLIEEDEAGFTSESLCLSIYAPEHSHDKNSAIQLVSIFEKDYLKMLNP